ncbi:MAG: hypothetical protein H0U59_12810, partial [Gemmatimonadaceae bacterium]|nr:hypothetical protein [Gemmatimonadaceae bacterium]
MYLRCLSSVNISRFAEVRQSGRGTLSALFTFTILAPRYLPRLASTLGLFTRYGLLDFAKGQGLLGLQGAELQDGARPEQDGSSDAKAVAFRERLVELGPAYIKLVQVLSTRPDLLPPNYVRELEHRQDGVPAMAF